VRPRAEAAVVHGILPAACRIRIEAFVEEVKGEPRTTAFELHDRSALSREVRRAPLATAPLFSLLLAA
jgi:hypothetical protein